jgi:hypothetical protein
MPKKIKHHFVKFLGLVAVYYEIMDRLERAHLLMSVISTSDPYKIIGSFVTAVFLAISIWFCWRFYTGVYRDGDFLD